MSSNDASPPGHRRAQCLGHSPGRQQRDLAAGRHRHRFRGDGCGRWPGGRGRRRLPPGRHGHGSSARRDRGHRGQRHSARPVPHPATAAALGHRAGHVDRRRHGRLVRQRPQNPYGAIVLGHVLLLLRHRRSRTGSSASKTWRRRSSACAVWLLTVVKKRKKPIHSVVQAELPMPWTSDGQSLTLAPRQRRRPRSRLGHLAASFCTKSAKAGFNPTLSPVVARVLILYCLKNHL